MSDHEGDNLTNWEDASLAGGLAALSFSKETDSLQQAIHPRSVNQRQQRDQNEATPRRFRRRADRDVPSNFRPTIQTSQRGPRHSFHQTGRLLRQPTLSAPLEGQAVSDYAAKLPSTMVYEMMATWKMLVSNMRNNKWTEPNIFARERLNAICRRTEAFIATPNDDTNRLEIWGTEEQARRAYTELETFEKDVRATGVRSHHGVWPKTNAFDGRNQSRIEREERNKEMGEALRLLGMEDIQFRFEAYFLWPDTAGLDLNVFMAKHDATTLDDLRRKTLCRIDYPTSGIKCIKVSAHEEDKVKAIYLRIVNLVKEMVAARGRFLRANRFKLPDAATYRDRVGWDQDPTTKLFLPTFHGETLAEKDYENWNKLCRAEEKKNRDLIRASIETCLKTLYAPRKHVRMRITFVELGFHTIQTPADGKDYVSFDDFCEMMSRQLTEIRPIGLRSSTGNLSELADVLARMPEFGKPDIFYTLHFDFVGQSQSTLRFETEHKVSLNQRETEVVASRWLEFGKSNEDDELLEVNMLDIEHLRSNYQIHIGAAKLQQEESKRDKSQATFASNITFQMPTQGFKAPPRRRSQYPPGRPDLRRVEEITIARFYFKDTEGIFELHRKDIFDEMAATALPSTVTYEAKYYYREWDMLMSEFSNINPGEEVSWPKEMSSFFLDVKKTDGSRALPKGFKTFIKEVEEISALLHRAIEDLPEVESGVNGSHSVECP